MLCLLQLKCVEQLSSLFSQISSPRELKCYVKEGLKNSQSNCLPLMTINLLTRLAEANLMCDDDIAANIQLEGVRFIFGSLLRDAEKIKDTSDEDGSEIVKFPGQDDRSMSPAFVTHCHQAPAFLSHNSSCNCVPCNLPMLHRTILRYTFVQGWTLVVSGNSETAMNRFSLYQSMYEGL